MGDNDNDRVLAASDGATFAQLGAVAQRQIDSGNSADKDLMQILALRVLRASDRDDTDALLECALLCAQFFYGSGALIRAAQCSQKAVSAARVSENLALRRRALSVHGVMLSDGGAIAEAIESLVEAMELAITLRDAKGEMAAVLNLGSSFIACGNYSLAIACSNRALALAELAKNAEVCASAFGNLSLAHLNNQTITRGVDAARSAIAALPKAETPIQMMNRVTQECTYVRLLLLVENESLAKERCRIAKEFALQSGTVRSLLAVSIVEGLCEAQFGLADVGITRLIDALRVARESKLFVREAIVALVKAYEYIGKPEVAVQHLRTLVAETQELSSDNFIRREDLGLVGSGVAQDFADVSERISQLQNAAVVAELREDKSGEHIFRVGRLAGLLALEAGKTSEEAKQIEIAARLHDIGKSGLPDAIVMQADRLNEAERLLVQSHVDFGLRLLEKGDTERLQVVLDVIRDHHEWWAGGGYPGNKRGDAISFAGRVVALADAFDSITHERSYREAMPPFRVLEHITAFKGKQFDPILSELFIRLIQRVQRQSGDLDDYLGAEARSMPLLASFKRLREYLASNR